jgi:hypothetical protein
VDTDAVKSTPFFAVGEFSLGSGDGLREGEDLRLGRCVRRGFGLCHIGMPGEPHLRVEHRYVFLRCLFQFLTSFQGD